MLDIFRRGRHAKKSGSSQRKASAKRSAGSSPQGTHTFIVHKPCCTPARDTIYTALEPRGVEIVRYRETMVYAGDPPKPSAQEARVVVRASQANWVEYLMERTRRLHIVDGRIDVRNAEWAAKYQGKLPTPWIEAGCHEAKAAWERKGKSHAR